MHRLTIIPDFWDDRGWRPALGSSEVSESDSYILGYRQAEQDRLERQARELAHESGRLFDQIDVRGGGRVIEIGCGPQGCLGLLSERVGPTGRVVGVACCANRDSST